MCCFASRILSVSDTLIFARLSDNGYQYLAYQMRYESEVPNAMILPLPVATPAEDNSVEFIDLSEYETFFQDLAKAFPSNYSSKGQFSRVTEESTALQALAVHEVGNFVASFVPTLDDFGRLDERFVIPKETWLKIPEYKDFGFAVFQLKDLVGKPHPMAFRFKTATDSIFFPTVHIHDGEVHTEEEFDHILFTQHAGLDSVSGGYRGPSRIDPSTGLVRSKDVAREYCDIDQAKNLIAPELLIHKTRLRGRLPNQDKLIQAKGSPTVRSFNYRRLWPWWPLAIPVAGLAWLLNRRNLLQKKIANKPTSVSDSENRIA